jgi:carbamoyl-phosphate synthase large subunit
MPKRNDISKILIIGSGPIIIGQACEFDYSGTQACKALRGLGYEIVLVNSNPATIMTDPGTADITYIEPLNLNTLTRIIDKERPDALLPNLGGQSALNLSSELHEAGVLEKYGVKVIGVDMEAIKRGEDRTAFKQTMEQLGIEMPRSQTVNTVEDAEETAEDLGYPVVIRPAYTMGGTGGGLVYNREELQTIAARGLAASMVTQILVEESVLGWEELELEVVRDAKNQMITVCFIESDRRYQCSDGSRSQNRPGGGDRDQSAHLPFLRPGLQGHGFSHRPYLFSFGRRPDPGRNSLLAGQNPGQVHPVRRLCGGQISPLGL